MRVIAWSLLLAFVVAGCLGSPNGPTDDTAIDETSPVAILPDVITGLEHLTDTPEVEAGGGIYLDGDLAYVSGQGAGLYIVNVSTPETPRLVGWFSDIFGRDVDLLRYHHPATTDGDGEPVPEYHQTVAVVAGSGGGMHFVDVSDPTAPFHLGTASGPNVHNVAVAPGTHIVYNSRSVDLPGIDVVDASDPEDPKIVNTFGTLTCHDVTFWTEGNLAFCPGVRETQVWDIQDPVHPAVVARIVNPAIQIHHWALPLENGTLLAIGDEFGGSTDAAAGCFVNTASPVPEGGTVSDPIGAVWFYDIQDLDTPVPLSFYSAHVPTENDRVTPCTAHFGEPIEDRGILAVGWRAAGIHLIDYNDPAAPQQVSYTPTDGDVWEARYHDGHLFTGDPERGLDLFRFV